MAKTQRKPQRKTKRKAKSVAPARSRTERSPSASRERQLPSPAAAPARSRLERVRMPPLRRPVAAPKPAAVVDHNEGKYVYCIIKSGKPIHLGALGMGTEPADVHTVHFKDIAAVVSNTPMVVHDPTRDNVLAHQRVNETVMQHHTVIPMSFGSVF